MILADVAKPDRAGGDHTLRRIGVGLALPIKGRDTVVTMGTRERQGVGLSKVSKFALFAMEDDMHQTSLLAGTPTFALVGTRARLKSGASFRKVQLRYAVVLDPQTGAITRAVWPVDGQKSGPSMVGLSGEPTVTVPSTVTIRRTFGVVPNSITFGMNELPGGRSRPIPPALAAISALERYSRSEADGLEKAVRAALRGSDVGVSSPVESRVTVRGGPGAGG